jgi:mannan endo-1,4-beta-mannosidase
MAVAGLAFNRAALGHRANTSSSVPRHIELGAWTAGLFDSSSGILHPEALLAFERLTGKKLSYAHYYVGWEQLANPQLLTQFDQLHSHGWQPVLDVNPYYFAGCPASKLPLYRAIAQGHCDSFLHRAGKNFSRLHEPVFLLFAWEMNNSSNAWSIRSTGSTPKDFVQAWRHVYSVFQQEKASNVVWVFCPNVPDDLRASYSQIYPGDNYVDWLGLDGYNWGTTQSWSRWTSFADVFRGSYLKLGALSSHKPIMIAEVGSVSQGGDKGKWYKDMLTQALPNQFPRVQAVIFYDEDRAVQEHADWKVDETPESLAGFEAGVHAANY